MNCLTFSGVFAALVENLFGVFGMAGNPFRLDKPKHNTAIDFEKPVALHPQRLTIKARHTPGFPAYGQQLIAHSSLPGMDIRMSGEWTRKAKDGEAKINQEMSQEILPDDTSSLPVTMGESIAMLLHRKCWNSQPLREREPVFLLNAYDQRLPPHSPSGILTKSVSSRYYITDRPVSLLSAGRP